MMKYIFIIILLLCSLSVNAEVGQLIQITSTTTSVIPPDGQTHITSGGRGGHRQDCTIRVNATNINTGTCGEYSICNLPPHYNLVYGCHTPIKQRIMPPPGTYDRTVTFDAPSTETQKNTTQQTPDNKNITETKKPTIKNTTPKKSDDKNNNKLWIILIWIIILAAIGLIIWLLWLRINKKEKPVKKQKNTQKDQIEPIESWRQF